MGKIGDKVNSGLRFGAKVAVVGGALLGAGLGIKSEYDGVKGDIRKDQKATLSGLGSQFQPQSQAEGERDVIGTDYQGNIIGGAKVGQKGPGVNLGGGHGGIYGEGTALPSPLDPSKLEPFGKKVKGVAGKEALIQGAGVVAGQQGIGGAIKSVAGAVFQAGQKPKDPIALKISQAGRDAKANPHVVAGAEGIQASNKELMGQLAGKLTPKKLLKKKKKK